MREKKREREKTRERERKGLREKGLGVFLFAKELENERRDVT